MSLSSRSPANAANCISKIAKAIFPSLGQARQTASFQPVRFFPAILARQNLLDRHSGFVPTMDKPASVGMFSLRILPIWPFESLGTATAEMLYE
jgi:hypothetical protein